MNELGMVVDVSHASFRTAMDAIEASETPVTFSHDGSYTLASHSFQARRLRKDEELLACARKGGVIGITAVPNRLSNDPEQSIECVLDHYDYMVNLVGVDHVAIGTDTGIGDSVGIGEVVMGRPGTTPARYMNGLGVPRRRQEHHPRSDCPRLLRRGHQENRRGQRPGVIPGG